MNKRKFALKILKLASMEEFSIKEMSNVGHMDDKFDTWVENGLINEDGMDEDIKKISIIIDSFSNAEFEELTSRGKDVIWAIAKIVNSFEAKNMRRLYMNKDELQFCCCQCGDTCYGYEGEVSKDSDTHLSFTCFVCTHENENEAINVVNELESQWGMNR